MIVAHQLFLYRTPFRDFEGFPIHRRRTRGRRKEKGMVIRTMESKEEGSKDMRYMVFTLHPFLSSFPSTTNQGFRCKGYTPKNRLRLRLRLLLGSDGSFGSFIRTFTHSFIIIQYTRGSCIHSFRTFFFFTNLPDLYG